MKVDDNVKASVMSLLIITLNLFAFGLAIIMLVSLYSIGSPIFTILISSVFIAMQVCMNICLSSMRRTLLPDTAVKSKRKGNRYFTSLRSMFVVCLFLGALTALIISISVLIKVLLF